MNVSTNSFLQTNLVWVLVPSMSLGTGQVKLAQADLAAGGNAAESAICQTYTDDGVLGAIFITEADSTANMAVVQGAAKKLSSAS